MGIIYKLKPGVKEFIIEQKKIHPQLSCRALAQIAGKEFQVKISKSSINTIIKQAGLSMPAGRRSKKPPAPPVEPTPSLSQPTPEIKAEIATVKAAPAENECGGAIFLSAIDALLGGSQIIAQKLNAQLTQPDSELLTKIQILLYLPLFSDTLQDAKNKNFSALMACLDKKISLDIFSSNLDDLNKLILTPFSEKKLISEILSEVNCLKFPLPNGENFYLDSQLHTHWPTAAIPIGFSAPLLNLKTRIKQLFEQGLPLTLMMAPDTDLPSKEFFTFLQNLDLANGISFLGAKGEELDSLRLAQAKHRFYIFGLWPWQFLAHRKVEKIGDFKPYYLERLGQDAYLAEMVISLTQTVVKQSLTIKGIALKLKPQDKILLAILTNLPEIKPAELVGLYLHSWPNLEETYKDFSRKVELSAYAASPAPFLPEESGEEQNRANQDLGALLNRYLQALDRYFRRYFLPINYEKVEFFHIKELFYDLSATYESEKSHTNVWFKPAATDIPALKYALARLNERDIRLSNGTALRFFLQAA